MWKQIVRVFCSTIAGKKERIMVTTVSTIILLFLFSSNAFSGKFNNKDLLVPGKIGRADFTAFDLNKKIQNNEFTLHEIGERVVTFHQRKIGEAIVEKDFLNYQFDKKTGQLLKRKVQWRDDLPEKLPPLGVTKEEAEFLAKLEAYGEVAFSELYIISPESDVFPINPVPQNPCWVVRIEEGGYQAVIIIDAVTGNFLGRGVPPPSQGFTLSGPAAFNPCKYDWSYFSQPAATWFRNMGYPTVETIWPTKATIQSYLQNPETKLFYEVAHGNSVMFESGCLNGNSIEETTASDIKTWLSSANKIPFSFIWSCLGTCDTRANTLSYELRKGSFKNTAAVGGCLLSSPSCTNCWNISISWQNAFFQYMFQGNTVKQAYDGAMADYPACAADPCIHFDGDMSFKVPVFLTTVPAGKATLVSPSGITYPSATTTFKWYAVPNATSYLLSMPNKISYQATPAQFGCADSPAFCSITLGVVLTEGSNYTWSVRAYTSAGAGPWSDSKTITISTVKPGKTTLLHPLRLGTWYGLNKTPTYAWNAVSNATSYIFTVMQSAIYYQHTYAAAEAGCAGGIGTCSITPDVQLADGITVWAVKTSNPAGDGPASDTLSFTAITSVPGNPTLILPSGTINTKTPTYKWQPLANITNYHLAIKRDIPGSVVGYSYDYTPTQANCGTNECWVIPPYSLSDGSYSWLVQASNSNGWGPASGWLTFTVSTGK